MYIVFNPVLQLFLQKQTFETCHGKSCILVSMLIDCLGSAGPETEHSMIIPKNVMFSVAFCSV